jgi:multiple sugar transport system permease protein
MIGFIRDRSGFEMILVVLSVVYLLVFAGIPLLYNMLMSLQKVEMMNLATIQRPFVGLENYRDLFDSPDFWLIARNTVVFLALSTILQLFFGLCLALFFDRDFPGAAYMRGLFLAAWITPVFAIGQVWKWIVSGDTGLLNYTLESMGLIDGPVYWLSDPNLSLYAVIAVNVWLGIPYYLLLVSVGLAAIPKDLYEAAELDGAGPVARFFTITLPLLRNTILALVALGMIFTLQQFDLIAALTAGGPVNASNVAQYWSWQLSFQTYDFAAGSAVSVLLLIIVIFISVIYVASTRSERSS